MQTRYERVLLKVSGEALLGGRPFGIDDAVLRPLADEIGAAVGAGRPARHWLSAAATSSARRDNSPRTAATVSRATRWACWRPS